MRQTIAFCLVAVCISGTMAAKARVAQDYDLDTKELRNYRLTKDAVQRFNTTLHSLISNPAIISCLNKNTDTLSEAQLLLEDCKGAAEILQSNGFKPREFAVLSQLMGHLTDVDEKRRGNLKQYPDALSPENAAFLEQNYNFIRVTLGPLPRGSEDNPDVKEKLAYRLTLDAIQRFVAIVPATETGTSATADCLFKKMAWNAPTMTEGEERIRSCPGGSEMIQSHGLKLREYLILLDIVTDFDYAVVAEHRGQSWEFPPDLSRENFQFMEENFDKIDALVRPVRREAGK